MDRFIIACKIDFFFAIFEACLSVPDLTVLLKDHTLASMFCAEVAEK